MTPGTKLPVELRRGGKAETVTVTVAELKQDGAAGEREPESPMQPDPTGFGMGVQPLTPEQARQLDIPAGRGVIVASVSADGRAAAAGLREGDVIEEVDGQPVSSVSTLRALLGKGERPALLLVHRQQATVFVTLERTT